ncbi:hypothetical protein ACHAXA_006414 [Cyclostephanos tholiformis]|uniref:PDZ domain-containing protein n=1 Tax=Cyclostephanos tholiformis TaxID=382380 RepID=A0ABD3SDM9_9STRA
MSTSNRSPVPPSVRWGPIITALIIASLQINNVYSRPCVAHGFVHVGGPSTSSSSSSSSSSFSRRATTDRPAQPRRTAKTGIRAYPHVDRDRTRFDSVAFVGRRGASSPSRAPPPQRVSSPPPSRPSPPSVVLPLILLVIVVVQSLIVLPSPAAYASDYASFTPEQRLVAEAWRTVDNVYIDRTFNHQDWFQMRQDAVLNRKYDSMEEARGEVERMLATLGDRYTRYLPPAKYDSIVNAATGNLYGVGVELATIGGDGTNSRVVASDVEPSGPAMRGGLRPGDVFVEVDGVRFDDGSATPDDVASVVRGPEGSKVGVVVERDGRVLDFILTREPIKITSVRGYIGEKAGVSGKVGVVRIKNFSGTTSDAVRAEIEGLKKKGAANIVLDLRGNPGGLLPGGVDTASLFLESNRAVVYVVNKNGIVDAQCTLADGIDLDTPLVLLVDRNTASAAEVMTAALKENKRAVVAGEQTFGKGIVQTIRQLEGGDNGGVAVTIARYETPDHHDINKQGIPVDLKASVDCGKEDALSCLPKEAFSFAGKS